MVHAFSSSTSSFEEEEEEEEEEVRSYESTNFTAV
jgi:hypothetical protein